VGVFANNHLWTFRVLAYNRLVLGEEEKDDEKKFAALGILETDTFYIQIAFISDHYFFYIQVKKDTTTVAPWLLTMTFLLRIGEQ